MRNYLFTSESVSEGHPDKVADLISDTILDYALKLNSNSHVACESLVSSNDIVVAGEISPFIENLPIREIVYRVLDKVGYTNPAYGFNYNRCKVESFLRKQSGEINKSVQKIDELGAGDQGLMFGYACTETKELMPLPIMLAHKLMIKQAELRKRGEISWLAPDAKSQVTVRYIDNKPVSIETIILSTQHLPYVSNEEINSVVKEKIIDAVIPSELISTGTKYLINPSGKFEIGGMMADTGLTGRKIIVDTYGGSCPHGGGCFSGKDATKVDRSGSYSARYIAKNIVASGIADKCTVQISYAIGISDPISLNIDLHGTGKIDELKLEDAVREIFRLNPKGIIETLDLRKPIFSITTNYGHFGRETEGFKWEKIDKIDDLNIYFNL